MGHINLSCAKFTSSKINFSDLLLNSPKGEKVQFSLLQLAPLFKKRKLKHTAVQISLIWCHRTWLIKGTDNPPGLWQHLQPDLTDMCYGKSKQAKTKSCCGSVTAKYVVFFCRVFWLVIVQGSSTKVWNREGKMGITLDAYILLHCSYSVFTLAVYHSLKDLSVWHIY